jgi:hypothetical protein
MKKIFFISISLIGVIALLFFGAEYWIAYKIKNSLNTRESRNYDLVFESVDVKLLLGKVDLNHILLVPLQDNLPFELEGSMDRMKMSNVKLLEYIFKKDIEIGELRLENPSFRLIRKDSLTNVKQSSQAFQDVFGDIIRRGIIRNFVVEGGNAELLMKGDSLRRFGSFTDLTIYAEGIETDSVLVTNMVPFQLDKIRTGVKNLRIRLSDKQEFKVGEVDFNYSESYLSLHDISLKFDDEILDYSHQLDYQADLFEIGIKEVRFDQLDTTSDVYGNWSVISHKMLIDSLVMVDLRNKNKVRGDDEQKPMFAGMLSRIPFPLDIDSLEIRNSKFTYIEIPAGNQVGGQILFDQLNAKVAGLITIDSLQKQNQLTMDVKADFMGISPVSAHFIVPYNQEYFSLDLDVSRINLPELNPILVPLANISIESGTMRRLRLNMDSRENSAYSTVEFDYEDLKLEIRKSGQLRGQKHGTASFLANIAIRSDNIPGKNNHRIARFHSTRNQYRGPFNFIWETTKTGLMDITPGGVVKLLTGRGKDFKKGD